MHVTVKNLLKIEENVKKYLSTNINTPKHPKVIAVSKTFKIDHIKPLINHGHLDFGENKVQEAIEKWSKIKEEKQDIKLHLIGRLQTNKVKIAIKIFDYIHSLDSKKLADKISNYQKEFNKEIKIFIQVNIGNEQQKNGIDIDDLENFYNECTKNMNLDIIGLMCLPPQFDEPQKYFKKMFDLKNKLNLEELSMGMSNDYLEAAKSSSTFLRIGSKIFGARS